MSIFSLLLPDCLLLIELGNLAWLPGERVGFPYEARLIWHQPRPTLVGTRGPLFKELAVNMKKTCLCWELQLAIHVSWQQPEFHPFCCKVVGGQDQALTFALSNLYTVCFNKSCGFSYIQNACVASTFSHSYYPVRFTIISGCSLPYARFHWAPHLTCSNLLLY